MNKLIIVGIGVITLFSVTSNSQAEGDQVYVPGDLGGLPEILTEHHADLVHGEIRQQAAKRFATHQLPESLSDWEAYRALLKDEVIQKTGFSIDHQLPLKMEESGSTGMQGYTVKNVIFQVQPEIYATANLYIPDGEGPFPGVVVMSGHSINGRLGKTQALGYGLALNGYVALTIDPWGAGERTTTYGTFEYHGANLGASLMNVGESLMGRQITDNMRGVDLLCSLPYVDADKIGATGASGGGNQTMWLAAMDERVKAAVPVVSVGTFESYVMGHNCICETLIDGLTFTEESGILALTAPRALLISNGTKDSNPAFYPSEMLRSFDNAMPIFELYKAGHKFSHLIFEGPHSYPQETREAMLNLFNRHLKGNAGASLADISRDDLLPEEKLMNFPAGQRDKKITSTAEYCRDKGSQLRSALLAAKSFDTDQKINELKEVLRLGGKSGLKNVNQYPTKNGWDRFALETNDGKLIPVWHSGPQQNSDGYVIMSNPEGGKNISLSSINEWHKKGKGVVIVDLSGTGETASFLSARYDKTATLHTLSRGEIWLGKTVLGEWVKELEVVSQFLESRFSAGKISVDGNKESGLAGLFLSTLGGNVENVVLRNSPISYLFDKRESIDFFSMGVHLPGFLVWGDISLAAALSGKEVTFMNPVSMSGRELDGGELSAFQKEFEDLRRLCKKAGETIFMKLPPSQ